MDGAVAKKRACRDVGLVLQDSCVWHPVKVVDKNNRVSVECSKPVCLIPRHHPHRHYHHVRRHLTRHLSQRCYGDYCHYAGTWTSHRSASKSGSGDNVANGSTSHPAAEDEVESESAEALRLVAYRSILKSRAEEEALFSWSQSVLSSKSEIHSSVRKAGCKGESKQLPTLTGSGENDLHLLGQMKVGCAVGKMGKRGSWWQGAC